MPAKVDFLGDGFGDPVGKPTGGDTKSEVGNSQPVGTSQHFNGIPTFDPAAGFIDGGTDPGDSEPRKRGRPRGSKNQPREIVSAKTTNNLNVDIAALLMSAHLMLASLTAPEMALSMSEAQDIEKALKELSKYYPIGLDPKKFAWVQLSMVMAQVYGTRAVAIYKRTTAAPTPPPKQPTPIDRPKPTPPPGPPPVPVPAAGQPLTPSQMFSQTPVPNDDSY